MNINNLPDAGNTKTYAGYAGLGLASSGDVNRAVPTAKGGTGTATTSDFLNNDLGVTLTEGTLSLTRTGTNSTASVPTTLKNAQITTKADGTLNYDGTTAVQMNINNLPDAGNTKTYAGYAGLGLASSGDVNRAVPTLKGGTGQTNTNKFLNSDLGITMDGTNVVITKAGDTDSSASVPSALKNAQITLTASGGTVTLNNAGSGSITKASIALDNVTNDAQIKTDGSNAPNLLKNAQITLSAAGVLSNAGGGTLDLDDINDTGNTKTYAGYAGTGLDSSGRAKVGIISGGVAITVADMKDAKIRAFAGLDSSGNVDRTVPANKYTNTTYADLAALDGTANTKLGGIATGATVGATWGTDLTGQPSDADILNTNLVTIVAPTWIMTYDGTNNGPRSNSLTAGMHTYNTSGTYTYINGAIGTNQDYPVGEINFVILEGGVEVASLTFTCLGQPGKSTSNARDDKTKIKSYWKNLTSSASGFDDRTDYTVVINGTTITDYWQRTSPYGATSYRNIAAFDGDSSSGFEITVEHDATDVIATGFVGAQTINDAAAFTGGVK
jgi:hypothetical protein